MLASLVVQSIKNLLGIQETWAWSLGWEDPLEKEMATHCSILAWRIPWREGPGGLQSMGSQRVGQNLATKLPPKTSNASCCNRQLPNLSGPVGKEFIYHSLKASGWSSGGFLSRGPGIWGPSIDAEVVNHCWTLERSMHRIQGTCGLKWGRLHHYLFLN